MFILCFKKLEWLLFLFFCSYLIWNIVLEQEDKEPLFDSVKTIIGMLEVTTEFAQNITFNRQKIQKALPAGHLDATTLADYLVKKVNLLCYLVIFPCSCFILEIGQLLWAAWLFQMLEGESCLKVLVFLFFQVPYLGSCYVIKITSY